ncbi:uncharacterized protein AMSG_05322 [Thecamonas trahens ATCC 50062]|uniref:Uncharacterized protein n=1 Tax=Thecamonas trahens ATCC 50062 TaxID=461836 RepID=A0A0L0DAE1_THETB|nr:hypothetical protein AMSG_05322 [Thecamonas trahens ATCC 50062]KNC49324.1 hypothetical protein AMSG_05322 [Thecamonas trahens ATCC 50062]|eukprot:XP_013758032.1 hypothetical protein AMSG_05322 [Thecamonas trahens ATCC 50062]
MRPSREQASFANFLSENVVVDITPQAGALAVTRAPADAAATPPHPPPIRELALTARFQTLMLHSSVSSEDKHPAYLDLLTSRESATGGAPAGGALPMGELRLVHRSIADGKERPDLSSELSLTLRSVRIVYDRDEWVRFYYFWRPADWELTALDLATIAAGDSDLHAPPSVPLKLNIALLQPVIILPPRGRACPAHIADIVARLNFSTIHLQNLPLKPPASCFSAGLFALPLHAFPADTSDFDYTGSLAASTRAVAAAYQVDLDGMWVEVLPRHDASPHVVLDPIPCQLDLLTYDEPGDLPSVELFLRVASIVAHCTHDEYLYFSSVYEHKLAWDVSHYQAASVPASPLSAPPPPQSPASDSPAPVDDALVMQIVDSTALRVAIFVDLALVELLDPKRNVVVASPASASTKTKARALPTLPPSAAAAATSELVSCLHLSGIELALEHRTNERVVKARIATLAIADESPSASSSPAALTSPSKAASNARSGPRHLSLRMVHSAALSSLAAKNGNAATGSSDAAVATPRAGPGCRAVDVSAPDANPVADLRIQLVNCGIELTSKLTSFATVLDIATLIVEPSFRSDSTLVRVCPDTATLPLSAASADDAKRADLAEARLAKQTAAYEAVLAKVADLEAALAKEHADNDLLRADVHRMVEKITQLQLASMGM